MKPELLQEFLGYQQRWLVQNSRFKIGLWARQTGKDYTCTAEAVFDCAFTPKTHWLILACGERQARESLEKAKEWARWCHDLKPHHLPRLAIKRESATEIRFTNGSRITALPARPGTIRGYSANLILTEFAFHDDPEALWRAIFPSISNPLRGGPKKVRIISTPNGQGNYFHELWTSSKIFARHRITIHDAVAQGLPMDVAALKEGLLDAEAWAQEYECEFADQSSVLLPYELMEQCEVAEATETSAVEQLSRSWDANVRHAPELYVGIDFGRKQDVTVCWVFEKVANNGLGLRLRAGLGGDGSFPLALNRNLNPNLVPSPSLAHSAACRPSSPSFDSGLLTSSPATAGKVSSSFITREVLVLRRSPTPAQIEALRPRVQLARRVCVD